ncbi:Hypothetical protein YALI2_E01075g [Yarrowia lipolytica]|nr:Hypothetical protein YALI2_E01075g [Yarrowia lipolytica]
MPGDSSSATTAAPAGGPAGGPAAAPAPEAPSAALLLQQELSRTEYYRMERAQRSLQLFDQAVKYNVPPALIPLLFTQNDAASASTHITTELDKLAQDAPMSLTSYSALVQAAAAAAANVLTQSASIPVAAQAPPNTYPSTHSTPSHSGTPGVSISAQAGAIAAAAAQGVVPGTPQRQQQQQQPPHESARLMSPLHKDSRMSFRHHQRNLSMPSKPTDYGSQSPRRFQFGPVHPMQHMQQPPQPQLHPSPPIYSNSPHAQAATHTSPVRGPVGPWPYYAPGVAAGTPGAGTPGVVGTPVGPPGAPSGMPGTPSGAAAGSPPSSPQPVAPPSQSMHHIIQFHHWQPTRTPSNTKKEKEQKEKQERERRGGDRKDKDRERDDEEESGGGRKRRRSDAAGASARAEATAPEREREREREREKEREREREQRGAERSARGSRGSDASSNADAAESASSSSTTAIANAASLSNRRKTHTRHRSETSIRSDSFNRSLNYFQSGGGGTAGGTGSELSSLSIPEYPYKTDAVSSERTTPNPQAKSHKHGVDFMIDKEK